MFIKIGFEDTKIKSSAANINNENRFIFHFKKDGEALVKSVTAEGPIEAALMLMREIGMPVELVKYRQLVVPEKDKLWAGRGLSRMLLQANGVELEGRGVSSDTLKANMRALFGGVNLLYKKPLQRHCKERSDP